jgi:hypothetical protein
MSEGLLCAYTGVIGTEKLHLKRDAGQGNKQVSLLGQSLSIPKTTYLGTERGGRDIEEGGGTLRSHGLGEHRLARAGRSVSVWWREREGRRSV